MNHLASNTLPESRHEQQPKNHTAASPSRQHETPQCRKAELRSTESQQTAPQWPEDSRSPRLTNGVRFESCGCCTYQQVFITPAIFQIPERYVLGMLKTFTCRYHVENPPKKQSSQKRYAAAGANQ